MASRTSVTLCLAFVAAAVLALKPPLHNGVVATRRAFLAGAPATALVAAPVVAATGEELKSLLESTKVEMRDEELAKIRSQKPEKATKTKEPKPAAASSSGGGGFGGVNLDIGAVSKKAQEEGRARAEARRAALQKTPEPAAKADDAEGSSEVYGSLRAKREKQKADAEARLAKKKKNQTPIEEFRTR